MKLIVNKEIIAKSALFVIWCYLSVLMIKITLDYIPIQNDVAFLAIKQDEVNDIKGYLPIFYIHVYFSIFVLIFGLIQFFKMPKTIHRFFGYLYVLFIVLFAAPSGLFIGYYANGDFWAQIAFLLLGILWIFFTIRSVVRIKNKDFYGHQFDMYRSYALTLSALTLRAWKVGIVYFFQPNPIDAYIIVAWLGWLLNLILVEIYIQLKLKKQ